MDNKTQIKPTEEKCTCPKICDCQNPPPDGWNHKEGVYHISNLCPVHNFEAIPALDCPVHNPDGDIISL